MTRAKPSQTAAPLDDTSPLFVERVQTGVRMEKRILRVLKALAEYHDMSLGDLLEGIVLHAFEGKAPFGEESLGRIEALKRIYDLDLDASASHKLRERDESKPAAARPKARPKAPPKKASARRR